MTKRLPLPAGYYVQRRTERQFFWDRARAENWIVTMNALDATIHPLYSLEALQEVANGQHDEEAPPHAERR